MKLPFFCKENLDISSEIVVLDEATSKHVVQVLRMQNGEQLQITNGKGYVFTGEIADNNRKRCSVKLIENIKISKPTSKNTVAISLIKNTNRFEWFLEKATEIGVNEIIPLICERTEKTAFKFERLNGILISAMLQSQQAWLPVLHGPTKFSTCLQDAEQANKFIAHCEDEKNKHQLSDVFKKLSGDTLIMIGPEGDFSLNEISFAKENNFTPVTLSNTRLRTETAGIVAATMLCNP